MVVHSCSWRRRLGAGFASALLASAGLFGFGGTAAAVVGGEVVHDAPSWAVVLGTDDGNEMHCSGSLVASQWVLTAAHCSGGDDYTVARVGSRSTFSGGTLVETGDTFRLQGTDIRLYKLQTEVSNTPIELAKTSPSDGEKATGYGYGQTCTHLGDCGISKRLKTYDTTLKDCGPSDVKLCIDNTPDAAPCYGDSGSPLLVDGRQVGVFSQLDKVCGQGTSWYVNLTKYRSWVEDNIRD